MDSNSAPQATILLVLLFFVYLFLKNRIGSGGGAAPAGIARGPGSVGQLPSLHYGDLEDPSLIALIAQLAPFLLDALRDEGDSRLREDDERRRRPPEDDMKNADEKVREDKEKSLRDDADTKEIGRAHV